MSGSTVIHGLMIFFSITTVGVLLYPLMKLAPCWQERRISNKVALHRTALEEIERKLAQAGQDALLVCRLMAQRDFHRQALQFLAREIPAPTVTGPLPIDIAA